MSGPDVGTAVPAFFGYMGAAVALLLSNWGSAVGMAKSGVSGVAWRGVVWRGKVGD